MPTTVPTHLMFPTDLMFPKFPDRAILLLGTFPNGDNLVLDVDGPGICWVTPMPLSEIAANGTPQKRSPEGTVINGIYPYEMECLPKLLHALQEGKNIEQQ